MNEAAVYERLAEILDEAVPDVPGMPEGHSIVHSHACCWWTTDVRDALTLARADRAPGPAIPICPSCQSVLYCAPAEQFIAAALKGEGHPSAPPLDLFLAGYRSIPCHPTWDLYTPWEP